MAKQRQTDVNINYKVNTVEIEKGNALLNRASVATDNLRKTTQTFGTQASAAYKFTSKAIEGMEIEVARLRQQVKLASTQNVADVKRLSDQYRSAKQQLDAYNKSLLEVSKNTKQTSISTQQMAKGFGDVYTAARLFIAAGFAREILNVSLEMAKLSGNVEGVQKAFNRLPGATLLLKSLQDATHGTVTDLELMQKALQAQNFRIPLKDLGTLLEFAAAKAQQTGQEVNHLVDYIVSGIGYRSIKRLDDLGFTANRVRDALGGVSLQAATMQQVMTAVTTLMNEDLAKTGGFVETSKQAVEQLGVAWHELGVEVSKQGTSTGFIGFLKDAVNAMRLFAAAGFDPKKLPIVVAIESIKESAINAAKAVQDSNKSLTEQQAILNTDNRITQLSESLKIVEDLSATEKERLETLKAEIITLEEKNKSFIGLQKLGTEEGKLIISHKEEIKALEESTSQRVRNKSVLSETIRILKEYRDSIKQVREEIEGETKTDPVAFTELPKDLPAKALTRSLQRQMQALLEGLAQLQGVTPIVLPVEIVPMDGWDKVGQEFAKNWKEVLSAGIDDTASIINATIQAEAESFNLRIKQAEDFYDKQLKLAGDAETGKTAFEIARQRRTLDLEQQKERKISALRKQAFEAEKEAQRLQTIINGAAGLIKLWVQPGFPAAIPLAVMLGGHTLAQLHTINQQQYRGFAKGEIDIKGGTPGRDSIPSMLMPRESVMTANETMNSGGILRAIRAKKLNDKVLKEIVSGRSGGSTVQPVDINPIVKGLKDLKDSQPDLVKRGNLIYEARKSGDQYILWVRSKSMSQ